MVLTLESDYALRIIYDLSQTGEKADAATLSERIGVSLRFTLKILRKLKLAGILTSLKGAHGGYRLVGTPEEISLYDVVAAIEGEIPIARCNTDGYVCSHPGTQQGLPCPLRHIFIDLAEEIKERLSAVTFADLLSGKAQD